MDLVLPQMVPVSSPSQSFRVTFAGSQLVRDQTIAKEQGQPVVALNIVVNRLFQSHAAIEHLTVNWNGHPVLLFAELDTDEYAPVWEYQNAKAVTTLRQNVTMCFQKGDTVLRHFTAHGVQYQAILMMAGSIPGRKGGENQRKLWKHVLPVQTEFAWLPLDLAEAFCHSALQMDSTRQYGRLENCVDSQTWKASITLDQMYFIGDSRSANELEVFINMPIERLRVGCGLQCTLPHLPLAPSSRPLLFSAAVKLLKFALTSSHNVAMNRAEEALWHALYPRNLDEHVLATLSALVLALVEGRTDLPLSGVFGAGKTRSAAILVVGLLVIEPNLKLMILTKENVAAQAVAEHIGSTG